MKDTFSTRALAVVLAVLTIAAAVLAVFNLRQENGFEVPTDGVWWVEGAQGLQARRVPMDSPAERAGIRQGDLLLAVNERRTPTLAPLEREMFRSGVWAHATYTVMRLPGQGGPRVRLEVPVILQPADRSSNDGFRLIALIYLGIGLYVLFRRWTAPKATHFYLFCLLSFVLYAFKYTGLLDGLDQTILWSNVLANALQPAMFLHFAVSFHGRPEGEGRGRGLRWILPALLYVPGLLLVGLQLLAMYRWPATELLRHRLDQIAVGYLALYYVIAAVVFFHRYRRATAPLERQQLKWLTRGTLLAVTPFTLFYAIPYMADVTVPGLLTKLAGLSLVVLPLTFSYAIVRYRLMDTDLIFKRGVTYTLATAALVGLYFAVIGGMAELVHARLPSLRTWGLVLAVIVAGLVFDPLKRSIQGYVDRLFDQRRIDYREALIEFGRELNLQTDLEALLHSIVERLPKTLLVTRVAVFLGGETGRLQTRELRVAASHGLGQPGGRDGHGLALGFLDFDGTKRNQSHLFWESPKQVLQLEGEERATAARLDLNYYVPCRVGSREGAAARTVAVLGLGLTRHGDFLSSEDLELLESLASYVGIAVQNAQLYSRLEQQVSEFERLKEFHENIVESINVGVFAVDPEDRVVSWNQRMEEITGRPRVEVVGLPVQELLPEEFVEHYERARVGGGPHTFYKQRLELEAGVQRIMNVAVAPLLSREAMAVGRIVLLDDITERVALESQLTQAEKLSSIGLLAAGVAHEVNTPLAVISAYTQILTKQMSGDARLTPLLEKITQQSFRASEIVNGLLNFSRTGGTAWASVDLNRLVRDTINLIDHQLKAGAITVDLDLHAELVTISANQGKVQQVLLNLLLNAKDATLGGEVPRIQVTTMNRNGAAVVQVHDNGRGIRGENLPRIFDPFFTTKTAPREGEHKGTGLGLAVSYGIMQEHGGKIHVESTLGLGTTFELEFPGEQGALAELTAAGQGGVLHA